MNETIRYPKELTPIIKTLIDAKITPVIVGGYVRDTLLQYQSKDIDIELFGTFTQEQLISILKPFATPHLVGKSFGVFKSTYKGYDIDFSLPRKEYKTAKGHTGFSIVSDPTLSFQEASLRRDFTINAMGFDLLNNQLLDPYGGYNDLNKKILRVVNKYTFGEDPLRVLRAMQMVARFVLTANKVLIDICRKMVSENILDELPHQRIATEFEKLLLKGKRPSLGIIFLQEIGGFQYFNEFQTLTPTQHATLHKRLDHTQTLHYTHNTQHFIVILAVLVEQLCKTSQSSLLEKIVLQKKVINQTLQLLDVTFDLNNNNDTKAIYTLATQIDIALYCTYLATRNTQHKAITTLYNNAKKLGVLHKPLAPLITGKDLIALGLKPSQKFSYILRDIYEKQIEGKVSTKDEALALIQEKIV